MGFDKSSAPRKILYGVHGYGRGHAARAQAILPELAKRYHVRILAGDDAFDQLAGDYNVVRIPVLRYHHGENKRRCPWLTLIRNLPAVGDMLVEGPVCQMIRREIQRFQPDVVISDSEGWTHWEAKRLGIPRISFDHYGILAHCDLGLSTRDCMVAGIESFFYRQLITRPERIVVAAFFEATPRGPGVQVVGPVIRAEARAMPPSDGNFLLIYFSNANVHFTPKIEAALAQLDMPVRMYGLPRTGASGNIMFCPPGNLTFLKDLAGCRALFATAGNQMISEAIHFAKPLLLMPEESLEQRLNAKFIQQWGAGMCIQPKQVTPQFLREFLNRHEEFVANLRIHRRDGLSEALDAIDKAVSQLTA